VIPSWRDPSPSLHEPCEHGDKAEHERDDQPPHIADLRVAIAHVVGAACHLHGDAPPGADEIDADCRGRRESAASEADGHGPQIAHAVILQSDRWNERRSVSACRAGARRSGRSSSVIGERAPVLASTRETP